nr:Translation initiation factor eIF-2B subunit beta [Polyrhizophydium stewartii]
MLAAASTSRSQVVGSISVALETAKVLRNVIGGSRWQDTETLLDVVRAVGARLERAQPIELSAGGMAKRIMHLIHEEEIVIKSADGEMIDELETASSNIAAQALEHIHSNEIIMTIGGSSVVEQFLKEAAKLRTFQVIVAETAPFYSGQEMAASLAAAGIDTTLITDSAIFAVMSRVNKVILGTHAVTANGGLVAISGSHVVAACAKHHSTPVVVCAGLHTLSPIYPYDTDAFNLCVSPNAMSNFEDAEVTKDVDLPNPFYDYVAPEFLALFITNIWDNNSACKREGNLGQLSRLCAGKNQQAVQILLTHADSHGSSALLLAVANAHIEVSRLLLKLGSNANDANAYGWSPLMLAARNCDAAHIKLLLHHGAQVDALSTFGMTALACAVQSADVQIAQLLVEAGANVNLTGGLAGLTPLMLAANAGSNDLVLFLLQNGAECNVQSKLNGWTALMFATNNLAHQEPTTKKWLSREEHWRGLDVVQTLLDFGADIDMKNWTGHRAADIASANGKEPGEGWFSRLTGTDFGAARDRPQSPHADDPKRSATRVAKASRWTNITEDPGVVGPPELPEISDEQDTSGSGGEVFRANSFAMPAIPKRPKNLEINRERTMRAPS